MSKKLIQKYQYKECEFKIYKEHNLFYAEYEEISTYSDELEDLINNKIPAKYHACREFKL